MILSFDMLGLLAPAFFAGLIVASTHVPLGQEVLKRGIIFIDLAIAQIAALGMIFAHVVFASEGGMLPLVMAMAFALCAGALFAMLEKIAPDKLEALIGCTFVISACLSILLLSQNPHGGEHMQDLLAGQILWVDWRHVLLVGCVYTLILVLWFLMRHHRKLLFFFLFPVTVTLSVQLVGVYLVFASLIVPALATNRLFRGYVIAALAFLSGLILSTIYDLPSGPAIVCCYPAIAFLLRQKKQSEDESKNRQ